jgi:single-stranded-DNA-specific exonuclease
MHANVLPELKRRLRIFANENLSAREPEHLLRIHAELPLDRITPVLAGWLRKLEPLGHGNPEPIFVARNVRLVAPLRIMKDRHIRLELVQEPAPSSAQTLAHDPVLAGSSSAIRAVGWGLAVRATALGLVQGSHIHVAYRIRENTHPEDGGIEIEIAGIEPAVD